MPPAPPIVVVDTNVLLSTILGGTGATRSVVRGCIDGRFQPILGLALYLEYEDVLSRPQLVQQSILPPTEQEFVFDSFLGRCRWVDIYFRWRPNLRDADDDHLIELALAGAARWLVTQNLRDFANAELRFPGLRIARPEEFLRENTT